KNEVLVWDWAAGKVVQRMTGHRSLIEVMAVAPDEQHVATGAQDGMVRWWDMNTGAEVQQFYAHPWGVLGVAASPDGKELLSSGKDGTVRLWRLPDATPEKPAIVHFDWPDNPHVYATAFSPDGRRLMAVGDCRAIRIWDAATGSLDREIARPGD